MYRSKLVLWILTAWLAAFVSSAPLADAQDARSTTPKELVFSATPSAKGVVYKIDSSPVSDPLRGLGKAIEKYGDDLPVVCLIDSRLPIRLVVEAAALAGKAGFKHVRTFAVDHSSGRVSEIKVGPWLSAPK
jgi:predicted outer membrane protein